MIDVRIFPISTRIHQGFYSKNQWLENYYMFRKVSASDAYSEYKIKNFLDSIGKNSSDLGFRFSGCFLGLAIGDALGTTLEFSARKEEESHMEIIGGGP